ncbi:MAG: type II toxin-antitoxin system VapC family toxin [Bifidobacteriaceae bacterium]|nr:type II toxin-antitoxin system VapC family toxin [Bifidobacteriaceae bacterium]
MVVDTSALVAILRGEPDAERLAEALGAAEEAFMSAATLVELYAVADSRSAPAASADLDRLIRASRIQVVPFTAEHAAIARRAYAVYGRGSRSKARLNLGDCYSYALAAATGDTLLFTGDDFRHTDLVPAAPPGDPAP